MRVLLALGGNALLRRGESATARNQECNVKAAAFELAAIAGEHELIVSHGNGPRVGHMLELALRNELPDRDVVSVLTEVVVAGDDPAFRHPRKPIGPIYNFDRAQRLRRDRGWRLGRDGDGFRRLIPSPEPHAIAEIRSLRVLVDAGALVICADGGIPIALDGLGTMHGVEAAVDEDLTAVLLARRLDADLLVMLTDVDSVHSDRSTKVDAACRFAEATGRRAAVGALTDAARVVRGEAGTQIGEGAGEPAIAAARQLPRR